MRFVEGKQDSQGGSFQSFWFWLEKWTAAGVGWGQRESSKGSLVRGDRGLHNGDSRREVFLDS